MPNLRRQDHPQRRLRTLTAVALGGAIGVFLYGLLVGQRIEEASGIEGVAQLWWVGVLPVVIGILVATLVTTRRAARRMPQDDAESDEAQTEEFERSRAKTLARLTALVTPPPSSVAPADLLEERPQRLEDPAMDDAAPGQSQVASRAVPTSR